MRRENTGDLSGQSSIQGAWGGWRATSVLHVVLGWQWMPWQSKLKADTCTTKRKTLAVRAYLTGGNSSEPLFILTTLFTNCLLTVFLKVLSL